MTLSWPDKDPDEVLDYEIDWSDRLGTDTIATSTWTVPVGLTEGTSDINGAKTFVFLSGGTDGARYRITNRVVTAGLRTMEQSVHLRITAR